MKNFIVLKIIALALSLVLPAISLAATNVIYVNGINNTIKEASISGLKVQRILDSSVNHLGDEKKSFLVETIYNPVGFRGVKEDEANLKQDQMEMFLLKTAEELYGEDFQKIMVPFNSGRSVDVEAAVRVSVHLNDMTPGSNDPDDKTTPGSNSLEAEGRISDDDMRGTQIAAQKIVSTIIRLGSAVVVAHSQGNLLANLAYAKIASDPDNDVPKMIRVVNVANTSEFSVNSLNFTHAGDAALYSNYDSLDVSLETMPVRFYLDWRITPECDNYYSRCNFVIASPTFESYSGGGFPYLSHGLVDVYLSEDEVVLGNNVEGVPFTPGADRFVDRFEDFVYAAAEALEFVEPVEDYFKTVVGTVDVGDRPMGIAIADGHAYVANHNDDSVSVINLSTLTVIDTIDVGDRPLIIAIADGYAYVLNWYSVSVIDTSTLTVIDTLDIEDQPPWIFHEAIVDGRAYTPNIRDDSVSVIDTSTLTVIDTINVGSHPTDIAIANGYAYVTNWYDDSVSVIDTSTLTVIDTIVVDNAPFNITIADGYAYVVSTDSDDFVSVIDTSTLTVIDTIDVGNDPWDITIANGRAYVSNQEDDTVTILSY